MPNRRDILLGAATLAAVPGALAAQEAAPSAPRFHRMTVGSLPVAVVQDGVARLPDVTRSFVPGVPAEAVSAALAAAGTPGPGLDNPYNQTIVQTRAGLVLLDAGFGQGGPPGTGQRPAAMRAAGFDPAAVTMVVISHFHGDHVGGLLAPDGTPAFPNAAIKVPEAEWAFWNDAGEESRASEARRPGFANARRRFAPYAEKVERFRPGAEVAPGITAVDTRGHSPGHVSFLIADGTATPGDRRRRHRARALHGESRVVPDVRHGPDAGRRDAQAATGARGGGADAGGGLPLPLPGDRPGGKGGHGLPAGALRRVTRRRRPGAAARASIKRGSSRRSRSGPSRSGW